ncbi:thiamine-monophosphate kinase [Bacteroidota bacterium]
MKILSDFGERELIKRINSLNKNLNDYKMVWDDSSPITILPNTNNVWVTTDPSPIPNLVHSLGFGNYYHSGWLLAVKSLSDLAAMGSTPLGLLISCEFKPEMRINEFDDFFKGVIDCTKNHHCKLIGGNLKESAKYPHGVAFGIGYCAEDNALFRGKVDPGDIIFMVDGCSAGNFWAGIATHIFKEECKNIPNNTLKLLKESCLKPKAYINEGKRLLQTSSIKFCMDNSDGLLFSFSEIARKSNVNTLITIDHDQLQKQVLNVSKICNSDPIIWALGWGSYQLVCVASSEDFKVLNKLLNDLDCEVMKVGIVKEGNCKVMIEHENDFYEVSDQYVLSSDQFSKYGFWKQNIDEFVKKMIKIRVDDIINK